jgi:L-threonylcarbamoyladenylate synthase
VGVADGPERIDLRADPDAELGRAVAQLRADRVLAYPTETVYGFGSTCTAAGVASVRALKPRGEGKPMIVLAPSRKALARLVWSEDASELARVFWPGSVTLVLEDESGIFPLGIRSPDGAVAVRVSSHPVVRRLLGAYGAPITSTSANEPGTPPALSGTETIDVLRRLGGDDVLLLDAGTLPASDPSTIIDCTGDAPSVLREGTVPVDRLRCVIPEIHAQQS